MNRESNTCISLSENERRSNRLAMTVLVSLCAILVCVMVLSIFEIVDLYIEDSIAVAAVSVFFLLLNSILFHCFNGRDRSWMKYSLLISIDIICMLVYLLLSISFSLMLMFPMLICCRYVSIPLIKKFSVVSFVSVLLIMAVRILWGELELPFLPYPDGTEIVMQNEDLYASMADTFERSVSADPSLLNEYRFLVLANVILPNLAVFGVTSLICVGITVNSVRLSDERKTLAAREAAVQNEMNLAARIQTQMLPTDFPKRDDIEIYASMTPAREVGGDFYDFFFIDDTHVAVVIGDVSGKGVPAALFVSTAKVCIKDYAMMGSSPAEVFTRANSTLCENNSGDLFVTAWFGILDLVTGVLSFVDGGHNPPVLISPAGNISFLKGKKNLVLCGMEELSYHESSIVMEKGSKLLLYTDGVTERRDAEGSFYGEKRLFASLEKLKNADGHGTTDGLRSDVEAYSGDEPASDDLTLLYLEYK